MGFAFRKVRFSMLLGRFSPFWRWFEALALAVYDPAKVVRGSSPATSAAYALPVTAKAIWLAEQPFAAEDRFDPVFQTPY